MLTGLLGSTPTVLGFTVLAYIPLAEIIPPLPPSPPVTPTTGGGTFHPERFRGFRRKGKKVKVEFEKDKELKELKEQDDIIAIMMLMYLASED